MSSCIAGFEVINSNDLKVENCVVVILSKSVVGEMIFVKILKMRKL